MSKVQVRQFASLMFGCKSASIMQGGDVKSDSEKFRRKIQEDMEAFKNSKRIDNAALK